MFLKRFIILMLILTLAFSSVGQITFAAEGFFKTDELIEAEAGLLRSDVYSVSSSYASGGKYLVSRSAAVASAENLKTEEFSFIFDMELENDYKLYMRLYIPGSDSNQLFWRWNNGEWQTFTGTAQKDFYWAELGSRRLKAGTNKLQFAHKSTGVYYDLIYLSSDPDFVPEEPQGVEKMSEVKAAAVEFKQTQQKECYVSGDGVVFEAEDAALQSGMSVMGGTGLSGGKTVQCTGSLEDRSTPPPEAEGWLEFVFVPEEDGLYDVWGRTLCTGGGMDSSYISAGPETENVSYGMSTFMIIETGYSWSSIKRSIKASKGERIKVRVRPRESGWSIDQFVITGSAAYTPTGIESEVVFENHLLEPITGLPPVNPPAGEHPRLMFRATDIPQLKANIDHPKNAQVKETFFAYAKEDVELGTTSNENARMRIEAKALYYALYGDEEIGKQAVELAQEALNWEVAGRSDGNERNYELLITMHSRVYDWCYDLMNAEQRENIHNIGVAYGAKTEMEWPPNGHGGLTLVGHAAESVLLRGMLSFAIATYDERPDYWNYIGGRFYEHYVPERAWHQAAQMHHQGAGYGYYRHQWSCWAAKIVMAMGAEEPYDLQDAGKHAYSSLIYARRPDGSVFIWGDDWNTLTPMSYYSGVGPVLIMHSISKDPYVTDELMRYVSSGGKSGVSYQIPDPVEWLLLFDPNVEEKSIANLPNSYYFGSPIGATFARTGWEEGADSDTVSAVMFVNEYQFGNHQHKDRGSFQIWYKGPLASESGFYDIYGTENHKVWTYQSTAHNTLIVYDPDEPADNFENGVNDGGQYGFLYGHTSWQQIQENPEKYQHSKVVGHEIDPANPIKPYYTYMKGDLTNAYSDKISDYTRSFMFLDLKEENIPAALIVFDRVTTPKANLEKRWLLHGQTEPQITGPRSVWNTMPYTDDLGRSFTGKMVVDSLLPANDKVETDVIGGVEEGWNVINGVNYPHAKTDELEEENTYRMEKRISGENTTYFLNCIQVTDQSNSYSYDTKLLETDKFYGVEISDRVVMFSKSGQRVSDSFEIKGQSSDKELRYTVCDVEMGQWKITTDEGEQTVYATEDGGVIAFAAKGASVKAERVDAGQPEEITAVELGSEKSISVREGGADGTYFGFNTEPKIVNGKLMVAASGLAAGLGLKHEEVFLGEAFTDEKQQITLTFKPDSHVFTINGASNNTVNPAYYENGELMVELRAFAEGFNYMVCWDDIYKRAFLIENKPIVLANLPGYAKVVSLKNDDDSRVDKENSAEFAVDGVLTTIWAAEGKDRYIQIELEEEVTLANAEILFNPNSNRTPMFEIQLSTDGEHFETAYDGVGWSGTDGLTWETFTLDVTKPNRAKYIRYVGKGSDKSDWNAIREIRFKTGEDLVTWEEKAEYAKVSGVRHDEGEIDGANVGKNLLDNNNRTLWATLGIGRYVDLILENNEKITGVDIVFNPNTHRTAEFEISVSENGTDFVSVFKGKSNPDAENNAIEHYDFDKAYNAKYVRYTGNGSDISQWNGVKEIRVIKE